MLHLANLTKFTILLWLTLANCSANDYIVRNIIDNVSLLRTSDFAMSSSTRHVELACWLVDGLVWNSMAMVALHSPVKYG